MTEAPVTNGRAAATPRLILLPGMHGTAELFDPLLRAIPPALRPRAIDYPTDIPLGYRELLARIEQELAGEPDVVLLAESFSGPLAIRYASRHPQRVRAVVLSSSFASCPLPRAYPILFKYLTPFSPPNFVLRRMLVGRGAEPQTCQWVRDVIGRVNRRIIAHRLKQVARIDVTADLAGCVVPMFCLAASHDPIVRQRSLEQMLAIRPQIRSRVMTGPHMLLQLQPAESWAHIAEFLRSLGIAAAVGERLIPVLATKSTPQAAEVDFDSGAAAIPGIE